MRQAGKLQHVLATGHSPQVRANDRHKAAGMLWQIVEGQWHTPATGGRPQVHTSDRQKATGMLMREERTPASTSDGQKGSGVQLS